MIPRIIHYCWFGRNELPPLARRCIASWKKYAPEYSIVEWNEDNFDFKESRYAAEAYSVGKWAFVSDYARFRIIFENGGLYFDTDVELLQGCELVIGNKAFMACDKNYMISPGLGFGAEKHSTIIKACLDTYNDRDFLRRDGSMDLTTVVEICSSVLRYRGIIGTDDVAFYNDFTVYPCEYFAPKEYGSNKVSITKKTISIHHYDSSWLSSRQKKHARVVSFIEQIFGKRLVETLVDIKRIMKGLIRW